MFLTSRRYRYRRIRTIRECRSDIHFIFLKEEAGFDVQEKNAGNLIIRLTFRKEGTRSVYPIESAGSFNTRFIFRKEEAAQNDATEKTEEKLSANTRLYNCKKGQ